MCVCVSADQRAGYERYRGPYLHQLTVEDLRKAKPLWQEFFYNGDSTAGWQDAYNAPEHLGMLQERMEENLIYYLVTPCMRLGSVKYNTLFRNSPTLTNVLLSVVHFEVGADKHFLAG